jgi:hypothetical protein
MSNADRAAVISGLDSLSLGAGGGALQLLTQLENSMNGGTVGSYSKGDPQSWQEIFVSMKAFETAVQVSAQVDDWMAGKRAKWINFCDNVDNQHPAGFATAVLALDISIKASSQTSQWMGSDRSAWVDRCRAAGAQNFDWDSSSFVVSGLDGCEVLLDDVVRSVPAQHMNGSFAAGDYKTYGSLFEAVKQFEQRIKAESQNPDWMSDKRSKWVKFCDDSSNHSPSGFATAALALDMSVPASNNAPGWMSGARGTWVTRCRNAGARDFDW